MEKYEQELLHSEENKIDIFRIAFHIWEGVKRFWWCIPVITILLIGLSLRQVEQTFVPSYQAKVSVAVEKGGNDSLTGINSNYTTGNNASITSQMVATLPYIIESDVFREMVAKELEKGYINGSIAVTAIPNSNIFTLLVTSSEEQDAIDILESVIKNYPTMSKYIAGDLKLTLLQDVKVSQIQQIQQAYRSSIVKTGVRGILLGCIPILLFALTRNEIHSKHDIKSALNLSCIGSIPRVSKKRRSKKKAAAITIYNEKLPGAFVEKLKIVVSRVIKELNELSGNIVMVTSTHPEEGKSMVAANMAYTLAERGKKVILVDADLRKEKMVDPDSPLQKEKMNGANLEDYYNKKIELSKIRTSLEQKPLYVLYSEPNQKTAISILKEENFGTLMNELKELADYVIIDTPPVGLMADAMVASEYADGIVYVIRQDYVSRTQIKNAVAELGASNGKLLGCVLNYATEETKGYAYSKYKSYGYGSE